MGKQRLCILGINAVKVDAVRNIATTIHLNCFILWSTPMLMCASVCLYKGEHSSPIIITKRDNPFSS